MSKQSSMYRDSRWQQKRLEIMKRDNWTCQSCGASGEGVTLHVHHAYYEKGKKPWEYDDDMLVTWCEECHELRHELMNRIYIASASYTLTEFKGVANLIQMNEGNGYHGRLIGSAIQSMLTQMHHQTIANMEAEQ